MPVLNGAQFISEALDSVLVQPLATEIIVVDNGSSDGTLEILNHYVKRDPRVKLFHCKERGVSNALNTGLTFATGNLIARLDADDKMSPQRLESQLKLMVSQPKTALVSSQIIYINSEGQEIGISKYPVGKLTLLRHFLLRNPIAHPAVMFRKEVAEMAGSYRPEFEGSEDLDLWIRILNFGDIFSSQDFSTFYRVHENQITVRTNLYSAEFDLRFKYLRNILKGKPNHSIFSILQVIRLTDLLLMRSTFLALIRKRLKAGLIR
jgi:glycosyltransferase involved in cell wall biosynthesis